MQINTKPDHIDFAGCAGAVEGLGPGKRVVMWVRGCNLGCPGCMTPELWAKGNPLQWKTVAEVAAMLRPLLENTDGLTISGGEPMQQAAALKSLIAMLRLEIPNLEVLVYSGYRLEELLELGQDVLSLLNEIDMLVDGRFVSGASNSANWRGSDNQQVHYLSARSRRHEPEEEQPLDGRPLQIQMLAAGQFRLVGIPKRGDLERYRALMEERGIAVQKVKRF